MERERIEREKGGRGKEGVREEDKERKGEGEWREMMEKEKGEGERVERKVRGSERGG